MTAPAVSVDALTRPCPHCPDVVAVVAALHDLITDRRPTVVLHGLVSRVSDSRELAYGSLRVVCSACRGAGRILTDQGAALVALLPPEMRGAAPPDPDSEIPF
jgi:hypothetical protein